MAVMTDKAPVPVKPQKSLDEVVADLAFDRASLEVVFVDRHRVSCMGSGGALGHPRTYYEIGEKGYAECGYCDRIFFYDPSRAGEVFTG